AMQAQDGTQDRTATITVATLTAMVVGSMVGAGVFSLPSRFAGETGVLGALISWLVAGTGMLMPAFVFQRLAIRKPDLDSGVYATVLGFLMVLSIFASVTIVSYGILPMEELAQLRQPSMAGVLEAAVGGWGAVFVSAGLIVSVLGAYLAWTLMASEVLYVAAKDRDMPRFLARIDHNDVPRAALLLSTLLIQVMLVVTLRSDDAFT